MQIHKTPQLIGNQKEIGLLKKGISLRNVASITGTSVNTIRKIKELCVDTEK